MKLRDPSSLLARSAAVALIGVLIAGCNDPVAPPELPPKSPSELETLVLAAEVTGDALSTVSRTVQVETAVDAAQWSAELAGAVTEEQPNAVAAHGLGDSALQLSQLVSSGSLLHVSAAAIDQLLTRTPDRAAGGPLTRWLPCADFAMSLRRDINEPSPPLARVTLTYPDTVTPGCPFAGSLIFDLTATAGAGGTEIGLHTRWPGRLLQTLATTETIDLGSDGSLSFTLQLDGSWQVRSFGVFADLCLEGHCFDGLAMSITQSVAPSIVPRPGRPLPCRDCDNLFGDSSFDGLRDGTRSLDLGLSNQSLTLTAAGAVSLPSGRHLTLGDGDPMQVEVGTMRNQAFVEIEGVASYNQFRGNAPVPVSFGGVMGGRLRITEQTGGLEITGCASRGSGTELRRTCFDGATIRAALDGTPPRLTLHLDGPVELGRRAVAVSFSSAQLQVRGPVATLGGGVATTRDGETRNAQFSDLTIDKGDDGTTVSGGATVDGPRGGGSIQFCDGTKVSRSGDAVSFDGCFELDGSMESMVVGSTMTPFVADVSDEASRLDGMVWTESTQLDLDAVTLTKMASGAGEQRLITGRLLGGDDELGATLDLGPGIEIHATESGAETHSVTSGLVQVRLHVDDVVTQGTLTLSAVEATRRWQAINQQASVDLSGDVDLVFADLTPEGEPVRVTFGQPSAPLNVVQGDGASTIDGFTQLCFGCGGDSPAPLDLTSEALHVLRNPTCDARRPDGGRLTFAGRFLEDRATLAALAAGVPPICVTCDCNSAHDGKDLLFATSATLEFTAMTPINGVAIARRSTGFCSDDRGEIDADVSTSCDGDGVVVFEPVTCE